MKQLSAFAIAIMLGSPAWAQTECIDGRYTDPAHFAEVTVTTAVTFGSNIPVNGTTPVDLRMDIYSPIGDTLSGRPVVLVAFGGSFIGGARADVAPICEYLAHRGYVAIAPDYRVGFFLPNANTTTLAVLRCAHDLRAAIRFLRKTVAEDGNPYHIDPERIIVGGVSAGGIGAIHVAYLDQQSEIPPAIYGDTAALGGLEGLSGWPGYSSDVLACWSMSGAIGDTSWIQPGDQPLCSMHETGDNVVPYGTQEVSVVGIPTGLIASGSGDMYTRMVNIGVPDCFRSYDQADHVGYLNYDNEGAMNYLSGFLANVVCGAEDVCSDLPTALAELEMRDLIPVPNPVATSFFFNTDERVDVRVLDLAGRVLLSQKAAPGRVLIDVSTLPSGIYVVRASGRSVRTARIIKD
ncbi:MAG: T9SS type A sorting domain-containing protein [Bacteroidetes bacterium]|nr:T9SS type A sorting domain-containing protein [Bacteroidota bacterium]MBX7127708.1 T9SS type A sorting domain-containing protein [Flavobacteriales bacterium]MCC6654746.1 T9SS type A sorting domain-containing protein [Flavobacteriales bacterium]HMU15601.1 T9SS type A sorting domain-containing protein [Flavobacteriales bacterium]HMW96086.1 T9SS type A sorting domain-containing protein [Flavobacteriales bacterium]